LVQESRAYCEGRAYHGGDPVANPIEDVPYSKTGRPTEATAWEKGWQDREDATAGLGGCCQSEA
jgi:hypothetical protein